MKWSTADHRAPYLDPKGYETRVSSGRDAVSKGPNALTILIPGAALLILVPSTLVVPAFGGVGRPAVLVGLLALAWWTYCIAAPQVPSPSRCGPLRLAAAVMSGTLLIGYTAGAATVRTGLEIRAMDRTVIAMLAALGVMLLVAEGLDRPALLHRLVNVLLVFATIMAGVGIIQFVFEVDLTELIRIPGLQSITDHVFTDERAGFARVAGTAIHPIEFSVVLTVALPLLLHRAFWATTRAARTMAWGSVLVVVAAVTMSVSRTAVVGLVVGGVVMAAGWSNQRRVGVVALGAVFITGMQTFVPGLLGTIYGLFANWGSDASVESRTRGLAGVDTALRDAPLVGKGPGTHLPELYGYIDNQYVLTLMDQGLLGVVALLCTLGAGGWLAVRSIRTAAHPRDADFGRSLLAAVLVVAGSLATFDALSFPMATGVSFMVLGMTGAAARDLRSKKPARRKCESVL